MRSAVIVFPGSNRERDMMDAIAHVTGQEPLAVWHQETEIPPVDLIVLPGGFSYGDYLRAGAIAARATIMRDVMAKAAAGVTVFGVCNGFQILTEAGLLPGALMRNAGLDFVCRSVRLEVANARTRFTNAFDDGAVLPCPVAHHDGNYFADPATLERLHGDRRVAFRYADGTNPNGSIDDIAGILNANGNVLGMMPHPENLVLPHQGGGARGVFESLMNAMETA